MDLKKEIVELEKAKEQAKVLYFKYEGALEFVTSLQAKKEEEASKESKKK